MKRSLPILSVIIVCFSFSVWNAPAPIFMKIDGVDGESQDPDHRGEIDVLSWSWGVTNEATDGTGAGGGAGKAVFSELKVAKELDKSSPKLMEACATGKHIPNLVLTLRRNDERRTPYLKITMSDVLVSSYQTGGSSGDVVPVDQVSLNFSKIEYEYIPIDRETGEPGTPVRAGYDIKTNEPA